ncbi:AAA family ATPase [Ammonifex thiophilus]|uniref:MarR family transcriptional regulator n=1 Tax=Ammonifex thiophilus TaxID=444093 RepID=A0A3D8P8P6_9THEO|nr:AAA family ATPase [Ammonifex thiophilus]RDV84891.1 MarR family transcriptional regulator [Ammonifex thiophilus]
MRDTELQAWVLEYLRKGWRVIPLPLKAKHPVIQGWPSLKVREENVPELFRNANVGVVLGEVLFDVDLDHPFAVRLGPHFLPPTRCRFGREGKPGGHWLYRRNGAGEWKKWELPKDIFPQEPKRMLVELRTGSLQTVFPPSHHPDGDVYTWESFEDPSPADYAILYEACKKIAVGTLLAIAWPKEAGCRQNLALAVAGSLLRVGWTEQEVTRLLRAVGEVVGDEETSKRASAGKFTRKRLQNGKEATGWPRLAELVGEGVAKLLREWAAGKEQEKPPKLVVISLLEAAKRAELLGEDRWLIDRVLPERGLGIVAARPKTGKTSVLLKIASDVLTGTFCFGRETVSARVLWVTTEDSALRLLRGLQQYGVSAKDLAENVLVLDRTSLNGAISGRELIATAKEYGCAVVILEPLAYLKELVQLGVRDKLSYETLYGVLNPLALRAKEEGVLLLGVWHASRGKLRLRDVADAVDAPMGSTAYSAVADTILAIGLPPEGGGDRRRIIAAGRGVELDYLLTWDGVKYQETGPFSEEFRVVSDNKRKLLDLLKVLGRAKPQQLAAALGLNYSSVRTWLSRLEAEGLVARSDGHYFVI